MTTGLKRRSSLVSNLPWRKKGKRKKKRKIGNERMGGRNGRRKKEGEKGDANEWGDILGQKKTVCKKKRSCLTCYQEQKYIFEPLVKTALSRKYAMTNKTVNKLKRKHPGTAMFLGNQLFTAHMRL